MMDLIQIKFIFCSLYLSLKEAIMIDTKPSPKCLSILNDLKFRKQKLLFQSKNIKQNQICQSSPKQKITFHPTYFNTTFQSNIQTGRDSQKYFVLHIDETFFLTQTDQKSIESFLKSFVLEKDLIQLIEIESAFITKHERLLNYSSMNECLSTKMLKLNIMYALKSKSKIEKDLISGSENIYHIFIVKESEVSETIFSEITWTNKTWIFIVRNTFLTNKIQKLKAQKLYEALCESFFSYQRIMNDRNKKIPPIIRLQNLNCALKEGILKRIQGQQKLAQLSQLQFHLFKAQKNLNIQQSIQYLQKWIFSTYLDKIYIKKSMGQLIRFMQFYKKRQQNIQRRYFSLWAIITCQSSIKKVETEIIEKKYFQEKHKKLIKQKAFDHWKAFCLQKKQQSY